MDKDSKVQQLLLLHGRVHSLTLLKQGDFKDPKTYEAHKDTVDEIKDEVFSMVQDAKHAQRRA